jgi:hypothetical protein
MQPRDPKTKKSGIDGAAITHRLAEGTQNGT